MPEDTKDALGFALSRVQLRKTHPSIKPLRGLPGVFEIVADVDSDTYRLVYALKSDAIYVLHAFKKKSKRGIATPRKDMDIIRVRLKRTQGVRR